VAKVKKNAQKVAKLTVLYLHRSFSIDANLAQPQKINFVPPLISKVNEGQLQQHLLPIKQIPLLHEKTKCLLCPVG
jgi:hypothetical protein